MPLEQVIRERVEDVVSSIGSPYIEVQDHDNIHGVLVQVELQLGVPRPALAQANEAVRAVLNALAQDNPADVNLANWSACFTLDGRTLASSWPSGLQGPEQG